MKVMACVLHVLQTQLVLAIQLQLTNVCVSAAIGNWLMHLVLDPVHCLLTTARLVRPALQSLSAVKHSITRNVFLVHMAHISRTLAQLCAYNVPPTSIITSSHLHFGATVFALKAMKELMLLANDATLGITKTI